jgi:hypothetical protein
MAELAELGIVREGNKLVNGGTNGFCINVSLCKHLTLLPGQSIEITRDDIPKDYPVRARLYVLPGEFVQQYLSLQGNDRATERQRARLDGEVWDALFSDGERNPDATLDFPTL